MMFSRIRLLHSGNAAGRLIKLLAAGLVLALWIYSIYFYIYSREQIVRNQQHLLEQVASVVEEQMAQTLRLIRISLTSADKWVSSHPTEDPGESPEFIAFINELRENSGHLIDIRMVTREGMLAYVPKHADASTTNVSDRPYYTAQMDPSARGLYVAPSVLSRVTNKWGIPVSIRASAEKGRIAVLFGAIELDQMGKIQAPLRLSFPEISIALVRSDGLVLQNTPFQESRIGTSIAGLPSWNERVNRTSKGAFIDRYDPVRGARSLVAYSRLQEYPVIALVSQPLDVILKPWRIQITILVSVTLSITFLFMAMAFKLAKSVEFGERAWAEVTSKAQELEKVNHELQLLSVTDKLTGLCNRSRLDEVLKLESERSRRYRTDFSVILMDVDFFKNINDRYGHSAGDQVLVEVAGILKKNTRSVDTVGRWGGEEFLLLLPEIGVSAAVEVAEKIRSAVSVFEFQTVGHLTISLGVTSCRMDDTDQELFARADAMMYKAKEEGRNRVVSSLEIGKSIDSGEKG